MIRALLLPLALLSWASAASANALSTDSLLAAPIDTTLAPPPPAASGYLPSPTAAGPAIGGVVSTTFGSGGLRENTIQLGGALPGGTSRAFLDLGTAQGPKLQGRPTISGDSAALGVETALPLGLTLGVMAGYERDRLGPLGP